MGWFGKSVIATFLLAIGLLMVDFLGKRGVRGEIIAFCEAAGCAAGLALWIFIGHRELVTNLTEHKTLAVAMLVVGATVMALFNTLFCGAISTAPNPGLPSRIVSIASVLVFIVAPILVKVLPAYFKKAEWNVMTMLGVLLTVAGTALIAIYGRKA